VLLGQGHHISHEAVIDAYGTMVISRGKPKNYEKNPFQCHIVHHELNVKSPE
jgi:hypothetical protein